MLTDYLWTVGGEAPKYLQTKSVISKLMITPLLVASVAYFLFAC